MNPLLQIMMAMRQGTSPMTILQQMAGSDPKAAQAMRMIHGKSPEQLRQMAENMCREKGTTPEQVAQMLGITLN